MLDTLSDNKEACTDLTFTLSHLGRFVGPVAQSVVRWTPRGERTLPGKKGPGFEARQALHVYELPGGYGYCWWQAVAMCSQ